MPDVQSAHSVLDTVRLPAGHREHSVAPVVRLTCGGVHDTQLSAPALVPIVPRGQSRHSRLSKAKVPMGQMEQAALRVPLAMRPEGQASQVELPETGMRFKERKREQERARKSKKEQE